MNKNSKNTLDLKLTDFVSKNIKSASKRIAAKKVLKFEEEISHEL
jgi:hypothetical protein